MKFSKKITLTFFIILFLVLASPIILNITSKSSVFSLQPLSIVLAEEVKQDAAAAPAEETAVKEDKAKPPRHTKKKGERY